MTPENQPFTNPRSETRRKLRKPAEVAFYDDGGLHWGTMVDLSRSGARFTMMRHRTTLPPALSKGRIQIFCITTAAGTSKCRGTVRWSRRPEGRLEWGILFDKIANNDDDSLRITINHYFPARPEFEPARRSAALKSPAV